MVESYGCHVHKVRRNVATADTGAAVAGAEAAGVTSAPEEEEPAEPDEQASKETTSSIEGTKGADFNETTGSTQATNTATAGHKSDKVGHKVEASSTQHSTTSELSTALLAQQLPPLPKYNGSSDSSEETFQE